MIKETEDNKLIRITNVKSIALFFLAYLLYGSIADIHSDKNNNSELINNNKNPYICESNDSDLSLLDMNSLERIPSIVVTPEDSKIFVMKSAEIYLGNVFQSNSEIFEIPRNLDWIQSNHESPNFGYTNKELWTRFRLVMYSNPSNYYIRFNYPTLDHIEVIAYETKEGHCKFHYLTGDNFPQNDRLLDSHVFHLPLDKLFNSNSDKELIVFVRTSTTASLIVPIEIMSREELNKEETITYLGFGLYFGFLLAMLVYSLIMYSYSKERVYITFIFYLVSYFFMIFSGYGFANRFLYSDSWYLTNHGFLFFTSLNSIASILFALDFLNIKSNFPIIERVLYCFIVYIAICTFGFNLSGEQFFYIFIGINNLIPFIIIIVIAGILYKKYFYAKYFLIGWGIYGAFHILSLLRLVGLVSNNFITYNGSQIGFSIEIILLTLAMSHRLYDVKKKSNQLAIELLENKASMADQLKIMVEEKTSELQKSIRSIQLDVGVARDIQMSTLPKKVNWKSFGLDVGTFFLPKDIVSGDIYDLCQMDEDRFRIFIADATGHGIQAGFFTMSIRTEYERIKNDYTDTSQVLRLLNQSVFKTFGEVVMLYSCFIIDIDIYQGFFQYSSAGHPEQLLFQNNEIIELKSLNPIMGYKKEIEVRSKSIPISFPFQLFLYSDGVSEARNENLEEFGSSKIREIVHKRKDIDAQELLYEIFFECNNFSKNVGIEDDITMMYLRSQK